MNQINKHSIPPHNMSVAHEIERIDETHIVWVNGKPNYEISDVVVFLQNESGFAGFGACMSIIGQKPKLVAKIFSKLMTVQAFNNIPHQLFPEWRLYVIGNRFFFLRINHAHPTSVNGEEYDNAFCWLYTYPIYASIIESLISIGVVRSHFICADLIPNEDNVSELKIYDFSNETENYCDDWEEDVTLLPHTLIWASVFNSFHPHDSTGDAGKMSNVVIAPPPQDFIDRFSLQLILEFASKVLGLKSSQESLKETLIGLEKLEEVTNEFITLDWYGDDMFGETGME